MSETYTGGCIRGTIGCESGNVGRRRSRLAIPRGRSNLRNHGAAYGCS